MNQTNNFVFYSPDFNFERVVKVQKDPNGSTWSVINTKVTKVSNFDAFGYFPGFGQVSGFVRLILAICDLFRLHQWSPPVISVAPAPAAPPSSASPASSKTWTGGSYRLGGDKPAEPQSQPTPQSPEDPKTKLQKAAWLNVGRGLVEILPFVSTIALIAYSVILNKQQVAQIQTNVRKNTKAIEAIANPRLPQKVPKPGQPSSNQPRRMGLSDLRAQRKGQGESDLDVNINFNIGGVFGSGANGSNQLVLKYRDTQLLRKGNFADALLLEE